ncbi:MAG TPA: MaoC/PaaZ C-terminal domain-containing protein [Solirubrobacterales bacterium]|nr:MaoC/PaaZ C-terminal domain-containing protein [Solirubrobacterales bacterium]
MARRTLDSSPGILPLYARAAAPLIPGASLLPFVPGRAAEVPDTELVLAGVRPDRERVAAYARVCGFPLRDALPATYPHVLAFPLHMATMADGSFPFGAVGLVHVGNSIVQHRPLGIGEELKLVVRPTPLQPHKRGRTFAIETEAWAGRQKAWESTSTFLHRGKAGTPAEVSSAMRTEPRPRGGENGDDGAPGEDGLTVGAVWKLGGDLGRRYGSVSGDRNPIHMHSLTAKPLGFPSAIAHGMWTKARCLAALDGRLPDAFAVDVAFRKPIRLPGRVEFLSDAGDEQIEFAVRDAKRHTPHLDGSVKPVEAKPRPDETSGRKNK